MRRLTLVLLAVAFLAAMAPAQVAPPDINLMLTITDIKTFPNRTIGLVAIITSVNNVSGRAYITLEGLPASWTVTPSTGDGMVWLDPERPRGVAFVIVIPAGTAPAVYAATIRAAMMFPYSN